jgi:hypothetical protein
VLVEPRRQDRLQERPRLDPPEGIDLELRQAGEQLAGLPRREEQRDLLRREAPGHERERLRRGVIQPLRIVDDGEERALVGRRRHQGVHREADQGAARHAPAGEPEGDAEGLALGLGQAPRQLQERGAELLDRCERELRLPFDPGDAGDPELARGRGRVVEQGGLADSRFAVDDQHGATATARAGRQPVEHFALTIPAQQPVSRRENRR